MNVCYNKGNYIREDTGMTRKRIHLLLITAILLTAILCLGGCDREPNHPSEATTAADETAGTQAPVTEPDTEEESSEPDGTDEAPTESESAPAESEPAADCTHAYGDWETVQDATCTDDGQMTRACSLCGAGESQPIPATGHTEVTDWGKEALCTADGLTEGKHCSTCGEVLTAQETILATGHREEALARVEPGCASHGLTEGVQCSVCGEILEGRETIPPTGHTEVIDPRVEPTCTEDGLSEGRHCGVCDQVLFSQVVRPAKGHTEVTDAGREATCTVDGLTEGKHCSACGEVLTAQGTIPAKGHTEVATEWVEPTCTAQGMTEGIVCSVCGETLSGREPLAAMGHIVVVDPRVEPTCTEDGVSEGKHCGKCDKLLQAQTVLAAPGHDAVEIPGVPSSCTEGGLTEGSMCGRCECILTEQVATAPLGHAYNQDGLCVRCDSILASTGLEFTSKEDGTCYVTGYGTCTDTRIVIPRVSPDGEPVVGLVGGWLYFVDGLESLTIPNSVTAMDFVFSCLPVSVEVRFGGTRAEFLAVNRLDDMIWDPQPRFISCVDGEMFMVGTDLEDHGFVFTSNGDGTCFISGCGTAKTGVIPLCSLDGETVVAIGDGALSGEYFMTVGIPHTVTRIGDNAFRNTSMEFLYMADSVTYIGDYAFAYAGFMGNTSTACNVISGLKNLTYLGKGALATSGSSVSMTLTLPEGVTTVEDFLFAGGLWTDVRLILHKNVTYIGQDLFDGWNTHANIQYAGTVAEWTALDKHVDWNANMYPITITCADGEIITENRNFNLS